jgi:hypothetical protein
VHVEGEASAFIPCVKTSELSAACFLVNWRWSSRRDRTVRQTWIATAVCGHAQQFLAWLSYCPRGGAGGHLSFRRCLNAHPQTTQFKHHLGRDLHSTLQLETFAGSNSGRPASAFILRVKTSELSAACLLVNWHDLSEHSSNNTSKSTLALCFFTPILAHRPWLEGCLWRITPWAKKIAQRVGCWVLCESLSSDQSGNKDQFQRVHFDQIFALRRTNWTRCAIEQILHRCRRMFIWKNKVVGAVCSHQISCLFKRFLIYEQWICEMRRIEIVALWG